LWKEIERKAKGDPFLCWEGRGSVLKNGRWGDAKFASFRREEAGPADETTMNILRREKWKERG